MLTDRIKHYRTDAELNDYFNVANPAIADEERRRMQFLKRRIGFSAGSLIIDCGSGNGWIAREYLARDIAVLSVDISDKNLRRIKTEYDKNKRGFYVVADLYDLPFKNEVFDGATSNDVFEHLESPDKAARETSRCLKGNARFFVSVPYKENLIYYVCIHCNKPTPINAHLHSFDDELLNQIFTAAGFKIIAANRFINKASSITLISYYFCRWMPYWLWRAVDIFMSLIIEKQSRISLTLARSS